MPKYKVLCIRGYSIRIRISNTELMICWINSNEVGNGKHLLTKLGCVLTNEWHE